MATTWDGFKAAVPLELMALLGGVVSFIGLYFFVDTRNLLLAVIFGFIFLSFGRPVWAFGALLFSEFTAAHMMLGGGGGPDGGGISIRLVLTMTTLVLMLPLILKAKPWSGEGRQTFFLISAFFVYTVVINFITSDPAAAFKYMRHALAVTAAVIVVPAAARNRGELAKLGTVVVAAAALSGIIAIFQHYHVYGLHGIGARSIGLAATDVLLAGQLPTVLLPLFAVLLIARFKNANTAAFLMAAAAVMALGLYFSYTRTGSLALAAGIIPFVLFMNGKVRTVLLAGAVVAVVAFALVSASEPGNRYFVSNDGSWLARQVLWQAGIELIQDEPIAGIGFRSFKERSLEVADRVDPGEIGDARKVLGRLPVHNDFLGAWLSFGVIGFVLYCLLFVVGGANFVRVIKRARDPLLRGLAIGSLGALVAYGANSFYHNYFSGTLALPLLIGLSFALLRLTSSDQRESEA